VVGCILGVVLLWKDLLEILLVEMRDFPLEAEGRLH
jgi:hypothetical protein